jgi:predicted permease
VKLLSDILLIVLPVFLVIGIGSVLKLTPLVNADFLFQLNRLVYYLALPLLLFYKISTADFSASFNGALVVGLLISITAAFILSYGYGVLRSYPLSVRGTFSQASFRGNLAYIGLAMVYNAYGEKGLATAGILLGFLVPTMNFFSVLALLIPHRNSGKKIGVLFLLKQVCGNPLPVLPGAFFISRCPGSLIPPCISLLEWHCLWPFCPSALRFPSADCGEILKKPFWLRLSNCLCCLCWRPRFWFCSVFKGKIWQ